MPDRPLDIGCAVPDRPLDIGCAVPDRPLDIGRSARHRPRRTCQAIVQDGFKSRSEAEKFIASTPFVQFCQMQSNTC